MKMGLSATLVTTDSGDELTGARILFSCDVVKINEDVALSIWSDLSLATQKESGEKQCKGAKYYRKETVKE